jgi:hypothetical protein
VYKFEKASSRRQQHYLRKFGSTKMKSRNCAVLLQFEISAHKRNGGASDPEDLKVF